MEKTKTTTIQIKVSPEIKKKIELRALQASMTTSEYIRTVSLAENSIIVLDKGGYIARSLIEISTLIERSLRGKDITTELENKLLSVLDETNEKFDVITEQLTDIHSFDNESEND